MASFEDSMGEYKKQIEKGAIQTAYKGLMEYLLGLKATLKSRHPGFHVSSNIYFGYMDMSYFSFTPKSIKDRKLKIAIVFIHETFDFEIWLGGVNKKIQSIYWKLFNESEWKKYHIVPTTAGVDSIVESTLVNNADFNDLPALSNQIERLSLEFIKDIEQFLLKHKNPI
ncbi:MAG: hypothetical protein MUO54_05485 [Anaerolineales bacterium]|nr:hypothetical protein [Anaerolineales bacterium]